MNKQESILSRELEDTFENQGPPRAKKLLKEGTRKSNIESGYVLNFFNGKRWNDVTLKQLTQHYEGDPSACLLFMSPEAFRYYLPLFLRICLIDYESADVIYDTTLWRLVPSKNNLSRKEFDELYSGYDLEKKSLIARILQHLAQAHIDDYGEKNDAQISLDEYWNEYLVH